MNKQPYYYGASDKIFDRALNLRKDSTKAEKLLWKILRNRQVFNLKFRRQHPMIRYVADFYCEELKLVIELDGDIHELEEIKHNDIERQKNIEEFNITVLRFTNEDIFSNPDVVVTAIKKLINEIGSKS